MNASPRFLALAVTASFSMLTGGQAARSDGEISMRYLFGTYGYASGQRFSRPGGVFYDTNRGELYVADTGNGQIVILDKKGFPAAKFPHQVLDPVSGKRNPGEPKSLVVRKNGDILVTDNQCDYLDVLDTRGRSIQKIRPADLVGRPKAKMQPRCLALDAAGNVYIGVDGYEKDILVLTPELKLKSQIGVEPAGESKGVSALWVDKAGRLYAAFALGVCVRIYAPDGRQLSSFGTHESGPNNFSLPAGLVTDQKGRLWAVDTLRHVVSVFNVDSSNTGLSVTFYSMAIGGMGTSAGSLTYPSGIAGDGAGRIFVVESSGARVQGFELTQDPVAAGAN